MADFTPELQTYTKPGKFKFWCQKVLPLVYDDSLSYYELLCKVMEYINNLIDDNLQTIDNVESLHDSFTELQDYVNEYFANIDVTEEISDKIDSMVEDGGFLAVLTPYLQSTTEGLTERLNEQDAYNASTRALLQQTYSGPRIAYTVADMNDTSNIYVYKGTETGYVSGNWYYYNGSDWESGGVYQSTSIQTDTTLTLEDVAADAKATGDRLLSVESRMEYLFTESDNLIYNNISFWHQGAVGGSQSYMVHSDKIYPTEASRLFFGGICATIPLTNNNYIRFKFFDENDNLLYTGGTQILTTSWSTDGTTALVDYDVAYFIMEFSTNNGSVAVTPRTFTENYKVYASYTSISSYDDWNDKYTPTVNTLASDVENLENRVDLLELAIPSYWESYMATKIDRLRELDGIIGTHGFSFVFATDIHWQNNYKHSPSLINDIIKNTSVGLVVCGGDILTVNNSIDAAMSVIYDWADYTNRLGTVNVYGNHDNNSNSGNASDLWIGYDRWYGALLKPIEDRVEWSDNKKYCYMDIPAQKVRIFFLNTGYDQGSGLDNEQAGWMQQLIYELEEGWTALTIQHIFFQGATVASGVTVLPFAGSGTLSKAVIDSQVPNLRNRGGNFAGVVTGHVHRDYSIMTDLGYPVITTTCDANGVQASTYDPVNPNRTSGTTTEQAFDVYHIDTENKHIYVTRIGAGSDREFTYQ